MSSSELQRIASGLLAYLDANPGMAADLRDAAGQCVELAGLVGELAVVLPSAAGAAEYLQAAAVACDEAAALAASAYARGREWALDAVGTAGSGGGDDAKRNLATRLGAPTDDAQPDDERSDGDDERSDDEHPEVDRADDDRADFPADQTPGSGDDTARRDEDGAAAAGPGVGGALAGVVVGAAPGGTAITGSPPVDARAIDEDAGAQGERARYDLDTKLDEHTTARDVLRRYDPAVANLPPMTSEEAVAYIAAHKHERPWLAPAADADPDVQRVYATLDQGLGHAHHRHDGMGDSDLYARRVAYLEDPAQLDPAKRARSEDAFKPGKLHTCGREATRITSPEAFATAFARALEHPDVRTALETPWDPDRRPDAISLPIAALLGTDGHDFCEGFVLEPRTGETVKIRKTYVKARVSEVDLTNVPAPRWRAIETFKGGDIQIRFGANAERRRYEVVTFFANPPDATNEE